MGGASLQQTYTVECYGDAEKVQQEQQWVRPPSLRRSLFPQLAGVVLVAAGDGANEY